MLTDRLPRVCDDDDYIRDWSFHHRVECDQREGKPVVYVPLCGQTCKSQPDTAVIYQVGSPWEYVVERIIRYPNLEV